MGLFEKIFGSRKERTQPSQGYWETLNAYTPSFSTWRGSLYESDLVRAAIEAKANHVSKMHVKVLGAARPKLQTRLRLAPNDWQTWAQFMRRVSTILDVQNTAILVPQVNEFDETIGVACVLPSQCSLVEYMGEPYLRCQFSSGKVGTIELIRCGLVTKYQYQSDYFGETNAALNSTMDLISIQDQGIKEGVKSAATFRFMAQLGNFSKDDDVVKVREKFTRDNLEKGGGLLLFPYQFNNVKQIESKPFVIDAEQMRLIQTNVFNYFGVNEKIIQNSATASDLDAFYNGALEPLAIQLGEVLTRMLFSPEEQRRGSCIRVTSDRLQYMSTADKINTIKELGDRGMILIDEARELLNYDPLPDGKGQVAPIRGEYYDAAKKSNDTGGNADE